MAAQQCTEKSIFLVALEIESDTERAAYVERACAGNPRLRDQVQALMRAHDKPQPLLDAPPSSGPTSAGQNPEAPGAFIGPYKLIEQIGEGGMGTVWMAQQTEPVRRLVALKLIKPGMDSKQVIARFEAERQALALMDHPNIAKVLDAGTVADFRLEHVDCKSEFSNLQSAIGTGRPYFVMDLVKGVPITRYCDEHHLTPRQRLELFVPVCQAVQHAHQKGVIHRDLKPSNVLVALYDGKPAPKIIDFGVAKAIGQPLTEHSLVTGFGAIVGTLEYMSPEQAEVNQLDIDTRSDIYSLGVLLYELLTGSPPFSREELDKAGIVEMLRVIREEEPSRPSTKLSSSDALPALSANRGTEPAKLTKLVRGELDWIVMKALEKDRGRRYETANGFAMDLQRYLADEPVVACPPSVGYRLRKFVRRNQAVVLVVMLFTALLLVGTMLSTALAVWATRAEGLAAQRLVAETTERKRAVEAEREGKRQLVQAKLAQARAGRWSRQVGQRFDGLKALTEAAALARELETDPSVLEELRDEAVACLALADMRLQHEWEGLPAGSDDWPTFDANLEHYARSENHGAVSVRRVVGDRELVKLPGPGSHSWFMRFSPDGALLAAVHRAKAPGQGTNCLVWDWRKRAVVFRPSFVISGRAALDFSPDGRRLALGQDDGTVTVYEVEGWKKVTRLKTDSGPTHLAFHPEGHQLAVAGQGGVVRVWELATGYPLYQSFALSRRVWRLAWHPRGDLLAAAGADGDVHLCDGTTGRPHLTLRGHQSAAVGVTFAADGDVLISAAWDGSSRLWDPWSGRELLRFAGDARHVSKDGRRVASRAGHTLALWAVTPGCEYLTLPHRPGISGKDWTMAISPDGRWLVGCGSRGRVWDMALRKEVASLPGGRMLDARFHPNRPELFTSGVDGLYRWSFVADESVLKIRPVSQLLPPGHLERLGLDRQGRKAVVARHDGVATILCLENPPGQMPPLEHQHAVAAVLSPDGCWAATGTHNGFGVRVWDARTGKQVAELVPDAPITRPSFSADGRWLLTATGTEVAIWEVETWRPVRRLPREQTGDNAAAAAFSADGKLLAMADSLTTVRLFDTGSWQPRARLQGPDADLIEQVMFTPDGARLLVWGLGGIVRVWDLGRIRAQLAQARLDWGPAYTTQAASPVGVGPLKVEVECGALAPAPEHRDQQRRALEVKLGVRRFEGHGARVTHVAISRDGRRILSTGDDRTLRLWDIESGKEIHRFHGHTAPVFDTAFAPDGRFAVSSGWEWDGSLRLWDAESGRELRRFVGHEGAAEGVAFSPDGKRILSVGYDSVMRLWDVETGQEIRGFQGHTGRPRTVAFSPDGRLALSGGRDATIRLWDIASGRELRRFNGHVGTVQHVAFSPDGLQALSCGQDKTIRLWDVETGRELRCLTGHAGEVMDAAFSPDGRHCLSGGWHGDATIRLWDLESGIELFRVEGIIDRTHGVVFTPDGRHALFGAGDGIVRLCPLPRLDKR